MYAEGKKAWGLCQRSGKRVLLRDLVEDGRSPGLLVAPDWYDAPHPLEEEPFKGADRIALYRPSPEGRRPGTRVQLHGVLNLFTGETGFLPAFLVPSIAPVTATAVEMPEVTALLDEMDVEPDDDRIALYAALIGKLMDAGLWEKLTGLWLMAAHDEQAATLNVRDPGSNTITNNDCTFTEDEGFQGDRLGAYLDLNFDGDALSQDDCHIGGIITDGTNWDSNATFIGNPDDDVFALVPRSGEGKLLARVATDTDTVLGTSTTILGHFVAVRTASDAVAGYVDGELLGTAEDESTGTGGSELIAFARERG